MQWGSLLERYQSNGALDTSFGNNGQMSLYSGLPSGYYGDPGFGKIALQSDEKIVSGGSVGFQTCTNKGCTFDSNVLVMRLTAEGAWDTGFGVNGVVYKDTGGTIPARI